MPWMDLSGSGEAPNRSPTAASVYHARLIVKAFLSLDPSSLYAAFEGLLMAFTGRLSTLPKTANRRGFARRLLSLRGSASTAVETGIPILVQDLSRSGLLIQTREHLSVGDVLRVELPGNPVIEAKIVWQRGSLVGCRFREALSQGSFSAALLRSEPVGTLSETTAPGLSDALFELQDLEQRVRSLRDTIERRLACLSPIDAVSKAVFAEALEIPNDCEGDLSVEKGPSLSFVGRLRLIVILSVGLWAGLIWGIYHWLA